MDHTELKLRRRTLVDDDPTLIDLAETNLYRSLPAAWPDVFPPIEPSQSTRAAHRCHFVDLLLDALQLGEELRSRTLVSHGVRRSLSALFDLLSRHDRTVLIPGDVYPVYEQLARKTGVRFDPYSARDGLPESDRLNQHDALLICDPLKPWGGSLSPVECNMLATWTGNGQRLAIIDAAYQFVPSPHLVRLTVSGGCALLGSMSKGWLIPDHGGYCVVPDSWRAEAREVFASLPRDEHRLRVSFAGLSAHRSRPIEVANHLRVLGDALSQRTAQLDIPASPVNGYFARTSLRFDELLAKGCIGIPASVFGAPESAGCVLSTLPPTASTREDSEN